MLNHNPWFGKDMDAARTASSWVAAEDETEDSDCAGPYNAATGGRATERDRWSRFYEGEARPKVADE
jgi:hypothetical protein